MDKRTSDGASVSESAKIDAYQSGALVLHTRKLAELTKQPSKQTDVTALATAVVLTAAAALEALLAAAAYITNRPLYVDNKFRRGGVPEKFELLKGYKSVDVQRLWDYRKALSHAEPDNSRTLHFGEVINVAGAQWVSETVEVLAVEIWGSQMPAWFTETTGLSPKV